MMTRALALIALPLSLATTPALAQDAPPPRSGEGATEMAAMARTLQDPAMQARMADGLAAMVAAIMAMPVGPLAKAAGEIDPSSPAARLPRDATLADLAGARDPRLAGKLDREARQSMKAMGAMAGGLAEMLPALEAAMADFARSMDGLDRPGR